MYAWGRVSCADGTSAAGLDGLGNNYYISLLMSIRLAMIESSAVSKIPFCSGTSVAPFEFRRATLTIITKGVDGD